MEKHDINHGDWERVYRILKDLRGIRARSKGVTRQFVESVHFILKTGAQWRELPFYYGKWRSVHKRYESWCRKGIWNQILHEFASAYDGESVMIDATRVRAGRCAAGYKKGQQD